jgi:hypothetical protein
MGLDSNERRYYSAERTVNEQMIGIIRQIKMYKKQFDADLKTRGIFKAAARPLEITMRFNAVGSADGKYSKGTLAKSIKMMTYSKDKFGVYVGPNYKASRGTTAPHAHLIEFGWRTKNGKQVPGTEFVKKSYEQTKYAIINELERGAKKAHEKAVRAVAKRQR